MSDTLIQLDKTVIHPQLGPGRLLKTYMGGYEWEVLFDSGRRFRLPAREFAPESVNAWQAQAAPAQSLFAPRAAVLEVDQFRARQTLEALRLGIVPVQDVETLTIGLEAEQVSLDRALARSKERGGDALALIGDYGFGKSHFVELSARRALRENCLVAVASLDLVEAPPGKANEIYKALIHGIRYPDSAERGLRPLIRRALDTPGVVAQFAERSPRGQDDPLARALATLTDCGSQLAYDDIVDWLAGQIRTPTKESKVCLKKPPRLYLAGEVARQYAYMLTAISVLTTMLGYGGLAVLIDESEHYSLLRANQRERADRLLHHAAALPQHRLRLRLPAPARALRGDHQSGARHALAGAQPAPDQPARGDPAGGDYLRPALPARRLLARDAAPGDGEGAAGVGGTRNGGAAEAAEARQTHALLTCLPQNHCAMPARWVYCAHIWPNTIP